MTFGLVDELRGLCVDGRQERTELERIEVAGEDDVRRVHGGEADEADLDALADIEDLRLRPCAGDEPSGKTTFAEIIGNGASGISSLRR